MLTSRGCVFPLERRHNWGIKKFLSSWGNFGEGFAMSNQQVIILAAEEINVLVLKGLSTQDITPYSAWIHLLPIKFTPSGANLLLVGLFP
jgi:hypothetical protein